MATTKINLVNDYFPKITELSDADLVACRLLKETYLKQAFPDLDTSPNSVFGDLYLDPGTYDTKATEIAINRFISDLDLQNVENGIIYSCEFVANYLKNFYNLDIEKMKPKGIVRLTFDTDKNYTITRRTRYQFGTGFANVFSVIMPNDGDLQILKVGRLPDPTKNQKVLTQIAESRYAVDVDVEGLMTSLVTAGQAGTTDVLIDNLVGINALTDFIPVPNSSSLPALAALARSTFHNSTLNTKKGTTSFFRREFPEIASVSPIYSGEKEMVRSTLNPFGMGGNKTDLYIRSKQQPFTDTVVLRIPFVYLQNSAVLNKFVAELTLPQIPIQIESVVPLASRSKDNLYPSRVTVFASGSVSYPGAVASYSREQTLYITIAQFTDLANTRQINVNVDPVTGEEYGLFTVTYKYEPFVSIIQDIIDSEELAPHGTDVFVRGYYPLIISDLSISYKKPAGVTLLGDQAKTEILTYLNSLAHPSVYTYSKVVDSMYFAGADIVTEVKCKATLRWSVADYILTDPAVAPVTDYGTALSTAIAVNGLVVTNPYTLSVNYSDPNIADPSLAFYGVVTPKNTCFIIDSNNIHFLEVK